MKSDDSSPLRPHLVIAVGNHVVGDSRVEKTAITARDSGYCVTVLGLKHRSVPALGFIDGDIPVLRVSMLNERHNAGLSTTVRSINAMAQTSSDARLLETISSERSRAAAARRRSRPGERSRRQRVRDRVVEVSDVLGSMTARVIAMRGEGRARLGEAALGAVALKPEGWRDLWPQIVDYEEAFRAGFEFLSPDLIHVHDPEPMAGAVAYEQERRATGKPLEWLYDAHEWLPGLPFAGPVSQRAGWLEAERDLIRSAGAVITVTEPLARLMEQRHALDSPVRVVPNAPVRRGPSTPRRVGSVRDDARLGPEDSLVVYVGGIAERRGVLDLVRACALAENTFHIVFVAPPDPRSRTALRERAVAMGCADRVHILDYVDGDAVSTYIKTADIGASVLHHSPNHDVAIPTKVREYMQARLPVVGSDVTAQSALIRELGIGEVVRAGDARHLAAAIDTILDGPDEYSRQYSDKLLDAHSWDAATEVLTDSWQGLFPGFAAQPVANVPAADIAVVDGATGSLADHILRPPLNLSRFEHRVPRPIPAAYFSHISTDPADQGSEFVWEKWRDEYRNVRARISDSVNSHDFDDAETANLLRSAGVQTLRYIGTRSLDDVEMLTDTYPDHWMHEISSDQLARRARTSRRARDRIMKSGNIILTPFDLTAHSFGPHTVLLPIPVEPTSPEESRVDHDVLTVGVLPGPRSRAEVEALDDLNRLGPNVTVEAVALESPLAFQSFDVIVDSLSEDALSVEGLNAMASGTVVFVGARSDSSRAIVAERPLMYVSAGALPDAVAELSSDRGELRRLRMEVTEYLARGHSAVRSEEVIDSVLV